MASPKPTAKRKARASGNSHGPESKGEAARILFFPQHTATIHRHSTPPILAHLRKPALLFSTDAREAGAYHRASKSGRRAYE
jgi:hypothetical protein